MSDIRALVVPADEEAAAHVARVRPDHATFCGLVDDINTDTVFFADGSGMIKVPANGKSMPSHQPNPRATRLAEQVVPGFAKRDRIEGTAVFVGLDAESDPSDVPEGVIGFAQGQFSVAEASA